jgi:hypothetical protein
MISSTSITSTIGVTFISLIIAGWRCGLKEPNAMLAYLPVK